VRKWGLLVSELIFVAILLLGVASIYVPAALILAGMLGAYSCERASANLAVQEQMKKAKKARRS